MKPLWKVYAAERWSASWETIAKNLRERERISEEIIVMLTKTIVLFTW